MIGRSRGRDVQLGFVIDHSRCIGCHACTVACKSENDVPVGDFRTWVKYTESGAFPEVKRSFSVLRCNQCSDAPCVTICPVNALEKRADGIVDVDHRACIGCKGCMQACPYDALYINSSTGTAEKCHFCAHRTEIGLAPACAVVCPTEAIIPGDFHDPESVVSKLKAEGDLSARKTEAGTKPNVFYKEVAEANIDPSKTNTAGGFIWSEQMPGSQLDAQTYEAAESKAEARTVYDVNHAPLWGWKVSAYLFTKSLAAGSFLAAALLWFPLGTTTAAVGSVGLVPLLSALLFLMVTTGFLIGDLKRPERFFFILTRPNWNSWIARGTIILVGYGLLLTVWFGLGLAGVALPMALAVPLYLLTGLFAVGTAAYTAWLFGQAKGRVLWMKRGLAVHLVVQAVIAGAALLLGYLVLSGEAPLHLAALRLGLAVGLTIHFGLVTIEHKLSPKNREGEFRRVTALLTDGPYSRRQWGVCLFAGVLLPVLLLVPSQPILWLVASLLALFGLLVYEDTFVRAGQALPIS